MRCQHESCGSRDKIWLPYAFNGRERGLKPHLFCVKCGQVKSVSPDRPHRMGYYINIMVEMSKEVKITKVQMRLASIELEKRGIDDIYGIDRFNQEEIFIEVVRKYVNIREQEIRKFL